MIMYKWKNKYYCCRFSGLQGRVLNCHLNPNSVTLNMEAAHFCKMSEQMCYPTQHKNAEDTHGTMREMIGEIMMFLVT
jgi:hypothetical protein